MKKRILPIGLFFFLIAGLFTILLTSAGLVQDRETKQVKNEGEQAIGSANEYLALIRNNQHTGVLDPRDVIRARQQAENQTNYKNSPALDLNWEFMGPNNIGGRTTGLFFDNRDPNSNTIYAASSTGGIFKTTNLGSIWQKVNQNSEFANLKVSTMIQADNGTIYLGTGEGFNFADYSGLQDLGYEGGFMGQGIFKSDGNDNFTLVQGTQPTFEGEQIDWAYINELAIDVQGNRLFAATNNGLKYANLPDLNNWQSEAKYAIDSIEYTHAIAIDSVVVCDTFEIVNGQLIYTNPVYTIDTLSHDTTFFEINRTWVEFTEGYGICYDLKVSPDGWIIAVFNDKVYVSSDGDPNKFVNRSIYPENPDAFSKNVKFLTTNIMVYDTLGNLLHEQSGNYNMEENWDVFTTNKRGFPNSEDAGRIEFAIAPSDPNIVYAVAADNFDNSLLNIYLSEDAGQNWRRVAPGGAESLNILGATVSNLAGDETVYYQGDLNNSITVSPNNPYNILVGSVNMWEGKKVSETGFFQWTKASIGDITDPLIFLGILDPLYCHKDHHAYIFRPGHNSQLFIATDGGVYLGTSNGFFYEYQVLNRNLNVTQLYSVGISNDMKEVIGGAQDRGTIYISGEGNSPQNGVDIWQYATAGPLAPEGTDGGSVAMSSIRATIAGEGNIPPATFYSRSPFPQGQGFTLADLLRRSESFGFDYSANFISEDMANSNFITPIALWESFNDQMSRDSVEFIAHKNYEAGENVIIRSNILQHPFDFTLPTGLSEGDTIMVKDIIASKLFVATTDEIWMTKQALDFAATPEWFLISSSGTNGVDGNPTCVSYSHDANYVYVGTREGKLYRISNISFAYDFDRADVTSPNCVVATDELIFMEGNTQVVTSVAVDHNDPNKVLVTLGNYGNTDYVFYSDNATSDVPTFTTVQGNLPQMPVYSSVLEMGDDNAAIIGTEEGVWVSDNVTSGEWYAQYENIGKVPVMDVKQQTLYKPTFTITYIDPVTGEPFYDIYPGINNRGYLYIATFGRGFFRADLGYPNGTEERNFVISDDEKALTLYPNPASQMVSINFELLEKTDVIIKIYDLTGKNVFSFTQSGLNAGSHILPIGLGDLNKGTYVVHLLAGKDVRTNKLVIIK
jgi:hypothetical protein